MAESKRTKLAAKAAPHALRGAGKAGKIGAWGAGKAVKAEGRMLKHALSSREPRSVRWTKYGALLLAGALVGIVIGRLGARDAREEIQYRAEDLRDEARRRAEEARARAEEVRQEAQRKAEEAERADGSAGTGTTGATVGAAPVIPEEQEVVEQRIRTSLGEDPRTADVPHPNISVIGGVAELRGAVASEGTKDAVEEIARETEGVASVRNLIEVSPTL